MPVKYLFAVAMRSARDMRSAPGTGCANERMRPAERLDALRGVDVARDELLDLGDLVADELEPQRDQRRRAEQRVGIELLERADEGDLLRLGIGDDQPILALGLDAAPQGRRRRQPLAVLGIACGRGERHGAGIVPDERVQIAIDEPFEAAPVARPRACAAATAADDANSSALAMTRIKEAMRTPTSWSCAGRRSRDGYGNERRPLKAVRRLDAERDRQEPHVDVCGTNQPIERRLVERQRAEARALSHGTRRSAHAASLCSTR